MTSEISMASMSDIAFLLIIFFMVTAAFILKDGIHIKLPDKTKQPVLISSKEIITITITKDGSLLYNNEKIDEKQIGPVLREEKNINNKSFVLLKIHRQIKYSRAIEIIDIIKFSGIKKLSLKTI